MENWDKIINFEDIFEAQKIIDLEILNIKVVDMLLSHFVNLRSLNIDTDNEMQDKCLNYIN